MMQSEIDVVVNNIGAYRLSRFFLLTVIFLLLLTPSIDFIPGLPRVRLEDVVLLSWLFFVFPFLRIRTIFRYNLRILFLCMFCVLLPISVFNGVINGYSGTLADFNQIVRFLKYISVYLLTIYVFSNASRADIFALINYILWLGVFVFLLALFQYFNIFGMNEHYVEHVAPTQFETLINNYPYPRPVGMIGNPNELGFLFVIFEFLCLMLLMGGHQNSSRFKFSVFFMIFFFGIVLTMSRGSMFAFIVGLLSFYGWYFMYSRAIEKIKIMTIIFAVFVLGFSILNIPDVYEKFTWRFVSGVNVSSDSSFSTRINNWQENIGYIKKHPVLGVGPLRRVEFEHAADNEWLLLWRSYGAIGLIVFIGLMSANLFLKTVKEVKAFTIGITVSVFVYMIPAVAFHSLVLFPFLLILLAISDAKYLGLHR